ncbi:MAG: hypothetical protein U5L74_14450, partial [Ideonella sp.]|nr:hypothetical protein [Ideonella sp.]
LHHDRGAGRRSRHLPPRKGQAQARAGHQGRVARPARAHRAAARPRGRTGPCGRGSACSARRSTGQWWWLLRLAQEPVRWCEPRTRPRPWLAPKAPEAVLTAGGRDGQRDGKSRNSRRDRNDRGGERSERGERQERGDRNSKPSQGRIEAKPEGSRDEQRSSGNSRRDGGRRDQRSDCRPEQRGAEEADAARLNAPAAERSEGQNQRRPRQTEAAAEATPADTNALSLVPMADGSAPEAGSDAERSRRRRRRGRGGREEGRDDNAARAEGDDFSDTQPQAELSSAEAESLDAGSRPDAAATETGEDGGRPRGRGRDRGDRPRRERRDEAAAPEANAPAAPAAAADDATAVRPWWESADGAAADAAPSAPAAAAPMPAPVAAPAPAPVVAAATPAPAPVAARREPVRVEPYVLAMDELQRIAEGAGLSWVNSDADKIREAQAAIAAEPKPVHVPRERQPLVVVDEGPLVLVETRKDLGQLVLPFDQQAQQQQQQQQQ